MTNTELKNLTNKIYQALNSKQIHDSLQDISTLVNESSAWYLLEELKRTELEYSYLLKYFVSGANDPDRRRIYQDVIDRLLSITDKAISEINTKNDSSQYYSQKRLFLKNHRSIENIIKEYEQILDNINLYQEVDMSNRANSEELSLIKNKELLESELFKAIWVSFPQSNNDISTLSEIINSGSIPTYTKCLVISAMLLSLIQFYNEQMLVTLLCAYENEDNRVSIISLCASLLTFFIHNKRIKESAQVSNILSSYSDNQQFSKDFNTILFQLIRSKNTERLTQKVEKELIPKFMDIYPKAFKKDLTSLDISELEKNPQWKEILDNEGITKKIDELNKLQSDGADIFIGTFSHLKSFAFFNEIGNWFLPFHKDHSMITNMLTEKESSIANIILESQFFCDSDKYSFISSLASVPQSQRNMMISQFGEQNSMIKELRNSDMLTESKDRLQISNLYIQNIYRFFKLYNRKAEFYDPFSNEFDITEIAHCNNLDSYNNTINVVSDFYLKNEYYTDAIKYFKYLLKNDNEISPNIYQKIGFCYQSLKQYNKAINYYNKYDLMSNNDVWNLRHIAACYRALNQHEAALKYYKSAEVYAPDNTSLILSIGYCLLEMDKYDEALEYFYNYCYKKNENDNILDRQIAWCYLLKGEYSKSRIRYENIIKGKPNATDYLNFGHLSLIENKIAEAIELYKKSFDAYGNSIEKFKETFLADKTILQKAGVNETDISIVLDAFHMICNKSLSL